MSLKVERIVNNPIDSNCFVVHILDNKSCVIIDPGTENSNAVKDYVNNNNLVPEGILLTHEHFDHIWGVESLRNEFGCKLFTSKRCSGKIINPKKNLSLFYDNKGFQCESADYYLDDLDGIINFSEMLVRVIFTPGHSDGSVCFAVDNFLFTGDTILENIKTVVKLPGGNKKELIDSIDYIVDEFDSQTKIFPGHGKAFLLSDIEIDKLIS